MNAKNEYVVKFAPCNDKTICGIKSKTLYFSTVYDFNDFNDIHYIANQKNFERFNEENQGTFNRKFKELFKNINTKCIAIKKMSDNNRTNLQPLFEWLSQYNPNNDPRDLENLLPLLLEYMVFSSVGIFCNSDVKVFKDDAAQLMLGHYAENQSGLAMIYKCPSAKNNSIKYEKKENGKREGKPGSFGFQDRIFKWFDGEYVTTDMDDFLNKSMRWEYEKESRIFAKPGKHLMSKFGIELKAILYTNRCDEGNLSELVGINKDEYENKIHIEKMHPAYSEYKFLLSEGKTVSKLISKLK